MRVHTRQLETVDVPDNAVLDFVRPVMGFERHSRYALVRDSRAHPFAWLQSLHDPNLAFLVAPADQVGVFYDDAVRPADLHLLQASHSDDIEAWVMIILPDDGGMRVNLAAPVLVHRAAGLAAQIAIDSQASSTPTQERASSTA